MSEAVRKQLLERIEHLLEAKEYEALREVLSASRSADVAEVVEVLDEIARQILFDLLDRKDAGKVLEKIDDATRLEVVVDLTSDELTDIVATLPPDEAADVVADLSEQQSEQVLDQIDKAESDQIEKLLTFEEDTAGGIMTSELVKVGHRKTIREAIEQYRQADREEEFYFVFVVDETGVLKGMVGLPMLLRYPRTTPIVEVMDDEIPRVNVRADQEEVANTFRKNDLIAMPVVDDGGVLVGRITVDDVVDVMDEEAEEDVLVMAGTRPAELDTHRPVKAAMVRLPWLLTCMAAAMFSAMVLFTFFQDYFDSSVWACIVIFVPAIAAMGGNSGLQTSTIVVRGLATDDLAALDIAQVYLRESRVALIVAVTCGSLAGIFATLWLSIPSTGAEGKAMPLGLAVGFSMFSGIMLSTSLGLLLPFMFRKVGIDPAISSGPLVTTANDTIGYLGYFTLALILLKAFGG